MAVRRAPLKLLPLLCLAAGLARAETAVIAVAADPGHLNPAVSTAGPLHAVAGPIFSGLVALGEDGAPEPDLAEAWEVAPDGRAVRFRLRADARFHDGAPVTAEDVVFTMTEALFRWHARARAGLAPAVAAVEAEDARTVVFRLHRPHAALLRQLDATEAPILPRHVFAGEPLPRHPANARPVGSGPFRFESHRRDDRIVLVRHGPARLERLVFRVIPDATTQANALLAGEVDVLRSVAPSDVARLRARGMVVAETAQGTGGSNCTMTLAFNLQRPGPGDPTLRAALDGAVDRAQLLERVAFGLGRVAAQPIHSRIGVARLPPGDAPPAAVAPAPRGAALELLFFPAFTRWAELLRLQAEGAGLALRLRALDPAAFAETVFTRRDFDAALVSYCQGADPEIGFRRLVHSASIGPVPFSNAAHLRDAALDALLDAAASAPDEAARGAAYREVQRRLLAERPYLFLVETDFAVAWRPDLRDVTPGHPHLLHRAWRAR